MDNYTKIHQKEFKTFSCFIIFIFILYYILKSTINFNNDDLGLTWSAGTQIIPIIDHLRGDLGSDFMAASSINSPYVNTAKILSIILPKNKDIFIPTFVTLANIFGGIVYAFAAINIGLFVRLLIHKKDKYKDISYGLIFIIISFIYLIPSIFKYIYSGYIVGNWFFPISESLQPTGISMFFSLITIMIPLLIECKISKQKRIIFISYLTHAICIFIHPVISLFQVILAFMIPIINREKSSIVNWPKIIKYYLIIWIIGCLSLYIYFKQIPININDLFRIYVIERHPHHYLPSFYFNKVSWIFIGLNLLTLIAINYYKKFSDKRVYLCSILAFIILITTHSIQFIGVEILKIEFLIKLGISRMSSCFNFLYISIITTTVLKCLNTFSIRMYQDKKKNILTRLKTFKFINLTLLLIICFSTINIYHTSANAINKNDIKFFAEHINKINLKSNSEFIFDRELNTKFSRLREIGGLNIYSDDYFPFNTSSMVEWSKRKNNLNELLFCIQSGTKYCTINHKNKSDIYFLSREIKNNLKLESKFKIKEKEYFLYRVNNFIS